MVIGKLQTGLDMRWLEQGTLLALQDFNSWWCRVLLMVLFETVVLAFFRSLTMSCHVALG